MRASRSRSARRGGRRLGPALLAVGLLGCEGFVPDLGPAQPGAVCAPVDSDPSTPVTFADVQAAVLDPYCRDCHAPDTPGNIGFATTGLRLGSHVDLLAGGVDGDAVIVAGDPCSSLLWRKLVGAGNVGSRMPLGGDALAPAQIQLVADWIVEGAHAD